MSEQAYSNNSSVSLLVKVVLDEIFFLTQIDPACVAPDDSLQSSLNLSKKDVHHLFQRCAERLQVQANENQNFDSPRELVEIFKSAFARKNSAAA